MSVISGQQYLDRIDQLKPVIWSNGEQIKGAISKHPVYKGAMQSKANLYDMQINPAYIKEMTYHSPKTNHLVGLSYLEPKTKEDLEMRRIMITKWAKSTAGMMGRTPDYMNTVIMALAAASDILKAQDEEFALNLKKMYEVARENDYSFTHSFINPQVNRSSYYIESTFSPIAAKVVKKTSDGLVIKGARMLATEGGMTDEVLILPSGSKVTDDEFAFSFSVPSNIEGLKFVTRESFHLGESRFNYPLSSRFDEMDTLLIFDNVTVPWERVFFYHRQDVAHKLFNSSSFTSQALHQVVSRQVVKLEFILGLAQLLVNTVHSSEYQHVQEKVSEIIVGLETYRALLFQSEKLAKIDQFGTMRPDVNCLYVAMNIYPKLYPRLVEILQLLGGGGYMSLPTHKDFNSPLRSELEHYLQGGEIDAVTRIKIFRLAWDMTMSAFGTRQTHYERFFFGDPVRLASNLYNGYPRNELIDWVKEFLE